MEKKMTKAEREAFYERAQANADRLRQLAEKAQAELDKRKQAEA
jgi:hypothetical protein